MVTASAQDRSRIDDFLPIHDFSAAYEIRINAPPSLVYQCLLRSDFNKPWLVRLLMTISGMSSRWTSIKIQEQSGPIFRPALRLIHVMASDLAT